MVWAMAGRIPEITHSAPMSRAEATVFNARDLGRLRQLVDYINQPENWHN